ncbi:MAG: hypothetical protein BA866_03765 [Desulfobulbaceae bacterium S5133MH15]|nr:MAG: hypothetical protein BA866_03765 [Desulfobulbaceae bacterium S5133MH15]
MLQKQQNFTITGRKHMKTTIKAHHLRLDQKTNSAMERRLRFALGRFGASINEVTVRLTDLNGPKGGIDKECLIVVKLRKGGKVIVQGSGKDCTATLNYCADRIGRAVERELSRNRKAPIRRMRRVKKTEKHL